MAITFNCPHCKRPHRIDDKLSGMLIRCKKCARVIRAPGVAPPLPKKVKSSKPVVKAAPSPKETLEEASHVPLVAPIEGPTTTEQAPPPEIETTPPLPIASPDPANTAAPPEAVPDELPLASLAELDELPPLQKEPEAPEVEVPAAEAPAPKVAPVEPPVAETPAPSIPIEEPPVAEPTAEAPTLEIPMAVEPAPETPVAETPVVEVPFEEPSVVETRVAEIPVHEAPVAEPPAIETPIAKLRLTETPVEEPPAIETPVAETPAPEAAVEETPAIEVAETRAPELPVEEPPAIETPVAESPAEETPAAETPIAETPPPPHEELTAEDLIPSPVHEEEPEPALPLSGANVVDAPPPRPIAPDFSAPTSEERRAGDASVIPEFTVPETPAEDHAEPSPLVPEPDDSAPSLDEPPAPRPVEVPPEIPAPRPAAEAPPPMPQAPAPIQHAEPPIPAEPPVPVAETPPEPKPAERPATPPPVAPNFAAPAAEEILAAAPAHAAPPPEAAPAAGAFFCRAPYFTLIQQHLNQYVGPVRRVTHESKPIAVQVDLQIVPPTNQHPTKLHPHGTSHFTMVTSGMSSRPMTRPAGTQGSSLAELMVSLPANWPNVHPDGTFAENLVREETSWWPFRWLVNLARVPHLKVGTAVFIGPGYIVLNGQPPRPLAPNTALTGILVMPSVLHPKSLNILVDGKIRLQIYALWPVYTEEMILARDKGLPALMQRFAENNVTDLIDIHRKNLGL